MTTPFSNSIVGQQGTLVRSQIKSPNFNQLAQTGWAILKNGSAFFFNITATGTITATSFVGNDFVIDSNGARFYNGVPALNTLNVAIATAPGTDSFTNPYLAGVGAFSTSGNPATIQLYALLTAGQIQMGGGPPGSFTIIPTIASSNLTPTSILINSGSTPSGPNSGGIAALFLTTGATGGAKGYVLMTDQCTLLLAGAGPPQTVAALEMNGVNGTGIAISAAGGSGSAPAAVAGYAFLWTDASGLMHSSAELVVDAGAIQLTNVGSAPASVAGATMLYSDTFTQLHTDRALQTDVSLETKNLGAPPGAGGSGAKRWSFSGHAQVQSGQAATGGDTNIYDTERLDLPIAGGQVISSTTGIAITGLSKTLGIGKYHVRGKVYYQGNQSAGVPTIGFLFPALSAGGSDTEYRVANAGATQPIPYYNSVGFDLIGTAHAGPTLVLNQFIVFEFDGQITTTASGAFTVQAKTSVGADTFTIQPGSYLEIFPVVAS